MSPLQPTVEFLRSWVLNLASGRYPKGRSRLCRREVDGSWSYCCLGVAAEMHGGLVDSDLFPNSRGYVHTSNPYMLPVGTYGLSEEALNTLAILNDDNDAFGPVIDKIMELWPYAFEDGWEDEVTA